MKRSALLMLAWLTLAFSVAHAIPARPLYEPLESGPPAFAMANFQGSEWSGKYLTLNRIFIFEADGSLSYKSNPKTIKGFKNRGSWKLDGGNLTFEHHISVNNKLLEFRGIIQDANTIVGEVTYKNGNKVQQTFQRIIADPK